MRLSTILHRSKAAFAGAAQPLFKQISNIARRILKTIVHEGPTTMEQAYRPADCCTKTMSATSANPSKTTACSSRSKSGAEKLTLKFQLRNICLQKNIDFSSWLVNRLFDGDGNPFKQFPKLKFFLWYHESLIKTPDLIMLTSWRT